MRSGGTAQVGGSPLLHKGVGGLRQSEVNSPCAIKAIFIHCPLFSLTQEAQRKKLSKKETPIREFRALRRATNAPRRWIRAAF